MAELRRYEPTWRDRLAQMMMGNGRASPERRRVVEGLLGSSGLGNTGMGVVDVTPVGGILQAQEAAQEGDARGAALAIFAGPAAKTANRAALKTAQEMAAKGASRDAIWNETGWFKGVDGNWRFEIDDSASQFLPKNATARLPSRFDLAEQYFEQKGVPAKKLSTGQYPDLDKEAFAYADSNLAAAREAAPTQPLSDIFKHNDLYAAYPTTKDIKTARETLGSFGGSFNNNRITYGNQPISSRIEDRSVLLHEGQHAVQDMEGFARGGAPGVGSDAPYVYDSPNVLKLTQQAGELQKKLETLRYGGAEYDQLANKIYDLNRRADAEAAREGYRRLAGEVEARNVESRLSMTPEQRRATPPWVTQDVEDELQIIRGLLDR
jgi:hypothetical protein